MKELKLELIRYRGGEDRDYLYFWTEKQGDTAVHVSPMFESKEEALVWYKEFEEKVKKCTYELDRIRTG